jgi:hypothetical protein
VVCHHFHNKGVFIGPWGSFTNLEKSVWHQVVAGRPVGWSGLHRLSPPPWPSTPHVDTCPRSHGPNQHKTWSVGQGVWPAGRPLGPFWLVVWLTQSICQIHPRGDDDFNIWSILLYHPLKCSNLVPKFLKSNKH